MKSTFLLAIIGILLFVGNQVSAQNSGVPKSEFSLLVEIFDNSLGPEWYNSTNWLDTTSCTVADWYGITVENGHVTKIELSNNNLKEALFENPLLLPELIVLDLSWNNLDGATFSNLETLTKLTTLKIENNNFIFKHIIEIQNLSNYHNFSSNFSYAPQKKIDFEEEITLNVGEFLEMTVDPYYLSTNDNFQWVKNNLELSGETKINYYKANVTLSEIGIYYLKITNPSVPELTLFSHNKSIFVTGPIGAGIPVSEYNVLVDFYNSTNGNNWNINSNWLDTLNHSVADWVGLVVENGHVISIALDSNNIAGIIPNTIDALTNLELIALSNNNISGTIPNSIGNLSNLSTLSLDGNNLSGEIPSSITQLAKLNYLGLGSNNLDGEIPENIGNLLNLEWLSLHRNNLYGNIPESIGSLSNLRHIYLNNNQLTGTIPASIGNLTNLRSLELSNNQLSGQVPQEFENLSNIYLINIDNNLIGMSEIQNSPLLKSISIESNRQIPDELAFLLQMDTLHLEGNQLQFNDIEPIFSWENYASFNEFIYAPQDFIGTYKTIQAYTNQSITLEIDNYYPGASDKYQWYKNGNILPGKTNAQLTISNLKLYDTGNYTCNITNLVATDLTLNSRAIYVQVSEEIKGAGIPSSEYETLVEIYNSSNGPNWINSENWLDTIYHSVNDWFGITVENGHVTRFEMPGNNLNQIPKALNNLAKLKIINLESGEFSGDISKLEDLAELDSFSLAGNIFTFKNLTPVTQWKNYDGFKNKFNYSQQAIVGTADTLRFFLNDTIKLDVRNYESDYFDNFEWYKNDTPVQNSNNSSYPKTAFFDDNHAEFFCTITNSLLPDLMLTSEIIKTLVYYSSSDSLLLTQLKNEYSGLQSMWTNDTILNWPGVTFKNGKVTALDLSGLGLDGYVSGLFLQFDSLDWLDFSENNLTGEFPSQPAGSLYQKSSANNLSGLSFLNISNNRFTFANLEPSSSELKSINEFLYAPQQIVGISFDTTVFKYQDVTFEIENYKPGANDNYSWFKDGAAIPGAEEHTYSIINASLQDSGYYTCQVTNTLFPDLTLYSDTSWLQVVIPVGMDDINDYEIKIYPNPATQRIFVETGFQNIDLKIYNSTGILVLEKRDFSSGWIDIQSFNPGIYFFTIRKMINDEVLYLKVIFK